MFGHRRVCGAHQSNSTKWPSIERCIRLDDGNHWLSSAEHSILVTSLIPFLHQLKGNSRAVNRKFTAPNGY